VSNGPQANAKKKIAVKGASVLLSEGKCHRKGGSLSDSKERAVSKKKKNGAGKGNLKISERREWCHIHGEVSSVAFMREKGKDKNKFRKVRGEGSALKGEEKKPVCPSSERNTYIK